MPQASGHEAFFSLRLRITVALFMVYVVWGTTYHVLNIAMRSMPPLLMNGARFLAAGAVMLLIARWQRQPWPTAAQWRSAALVGGLMVGGTMSLVIQAQQHGIGTGLMATVVATMPMWLALWTHWGGERVPRSSWAGLCVGVAGAAVLAMEGDFSGNLTSALFAFGAPLCWSVGSYAARKLDMPPPSMASAAQWLAGGALGCALAWFFEPASHHWDWRQTTLDSALAWLYLLFLGTLLSLNAYLWLLQNTSAALAGSYSFVNPVVALWLGVVFGGEQLTGPIYVALPLILLALALIFYGQTLRQWWHGLRKMRD